MKMSLMSRHCRSQRVTVAFDHLGLVVDHLVFGNQFSKFKLG